MIDAVQPVLYMAGVEPERIYFDKFTPAIRAAATRGPLEPAHCIDNASNRGVR